MALSIGNIREVASKANELLREISNTRRKRLVSESRLNARVQKLNDSYGPEIERLKLQESTLVNQLVELVVPRFALLAVKGTKTIRLRNGEINLTIGREALEVSDNEDRIIRRIANHGALKEFTRRGKRTLD